MATPSKRLYARGFATDSRTERELRAGLAGHDIEIRRGRFPSALRTLAAESASSLAFVDLDGVSEPEEAASRLAGVCSFETALVAIGSIDTAQFSRALLQHGVADYLVKPVTAAAIREAAAALTEDLSDHLYAGEVAAFAGAPGSGASTLVAALARGIAEAGKTATVVDLDPVSGKMAVLLDAEPGEGLAAALAPPGPVTGDDPETRFDPRLLDRIAVSAAPGISLVAHPASGPLPARPDTEMLSTLLGHLANRTHTVLVTGARDPGLQLEILRGADMRAVLFEPALASIGTAVRLVAELGTGYPVTLIQCSTRMRRYPLSPAHIRYALADRRPDAVIPFDPALHAAATGRPPGRPGKGYRKALREAAGLLGGRGRA